MRYLVSRTPIVPDTEDNCPMGSVYEHWARHMVGMYADRCTIEEHPKDNSRLANSLQSSDGAAGVGGCDEGGEGMTLGELIEFLEKQDQMVIVPHGFEHPHSYRGYYDELAFEPAENVSVASMLGCAREALGKTYEGYKGGEFQMDEYTDVWIAEYGNTGESIGPTLLRYMIEAASK